MFSNVQFSHTSECRSLTVKFSRSDGIARDGEFFLADIATNIWDSVYSACSVVLRPRSRSPVVFAVARRSGWAAVGGRRRSGQAGSARQRAAGLCNRFYQKTPRGSSNFPLYQGCVTSCNLLNKKSKILLYEHRAQYVFKTKSATDKVLLKEITIISIDS
jgi:hypothetical protein